MKFGRALIRLSILFLAIHAMLLLTPAARAAWPDDEYAILIFIEENRLFLLKNQKPVNDFPIASGRPEWPSPIGQWRIVEKADWGGGFGGYWLGLNVPWGKYGIHGTSQENSIGYDVSHGCIRMLNRDARKLYDTVSVGTRVIINGGPFDSFGSGFRELIPGDRGSDVREIQERLKELGYFRGKVTGIYEDDLKKAIYRFQEDNKLTVKYTVTDKDYHAMGFLEFE
ncbi:MAG: L,D-transpeptidase family protein [Oscillospiraceae bacterium]